MQLSRGQVLGRYELLLAVARGGMAEVWAARLHGTRGFRKIVALKTILPSAIDSARMEQMFLAEAQLASHIAHPNVVHTLELGEQEGTLYLVLEWVDGESLSALLSQSAPHGGIPMHVAVNLIGQACKGLHAAHELKDENGELLGVVHRDISPQNILVSFSGTAKVVDFGIAKATQGSSTLTEAGEVKGKLAYMAPEQLRGAEHVDRRADIFSMGTLLYLMTTGHHPFRGDHPGATLKNITDHAAVAPPSTHLEAYPPELEQVVLKALKKDPDERYATAFEMLRALERALPEALESSFETQVAAFVKEVAGTGAHRRKQLIRDAGQELDRARGVSGASLEAISSGSLSALAIDGTPSGTGSVPQLPSRDSTSGTPLPQPKTSRGKAWALGLLAVAGGTALGLTLAGGGASPQPSALSSQPPPHASVLSEEPAQPKDVQPTAPVKAAESVEPDETASGKSEEPIQRAPRHPVKARPKAAVRRAPALKPSPKPSARTVPAQSENLPAPEAPAPPPKATTTARSPSNAPSNAWDPDSFGARQ